MLMQSNLNVLKKKAKKYIKKQNHNMYAFESGYNTRYEYVRDLYLMLLIHYYLY